MSSAASSRPFHPSQVFRRLLRQFLPCLFSLLLGDRAFARSLARARIGARPLPANRQRTPVTAAAVAADLHQPFDVQRDLLAEVAFHAALLFEHPAGLAD